MNYIHACFRLARSVSIAGLLIGIVSVTTSHAASGNAITFLPMIMSPRADQVTPLPSATPIATPIATPVATPTVSSLSADEQEVLRLTNELRSSVGCGLLTVDAMLEQAAVLHSADMADHNTMSHSGTDGSMPWDRAGRYGYTGSIGENVAMGYRSAAEVFQAWKASSGHYKNMVNCTYRDIGISLIKSANGTTYWTQIFGRRQ